MNKSNTLYWKTATDPAERIELHGHHRQPQFPSPVPCLCGQPGLQQTRT